MRSDTDWLAFGSLCTPDDIKKSTWYS